jgi:hypothetical protein
MFPQSILSMRGAPETNLPGHSVDHLFQKPVAFRSLISAFLVICVDLTDNV